MSETIVVPADLVRYLRRGLLSHFGFAAGRLAILGSEAGILSDEESFRKALWLFDATRAVLEIVGVLVPASQCDVGLGRGDFPLLVCKVLEREHQAEVARLQDAELAGFEMPAEMVEALGRFAGSLRGQVASFTGLEPEALWLGVQAPAAEGG
jgi:hypothetical protein